MYLACLLWHYASIDIFFRFEHAIMSLTLKERGIHVYLACLFWQYPTTDNFFRYKRLSLAEQSLFIYFYLFFFDVGCFSYFLC